MFRSFQDRSLIRLPTPLCDESNDTPSSELQEVSDDDLDDKPASFSISEKESTRPLYHLEDIEDIDLSHIETNQSIDDSLYNEKDSFHCFYVIFIISIHFRIHFY